LISSPYVSALLKPDPKAKVLQVDRPTIPNSRRSLEFIVLSSNSVSSLHDFDVK
jgi:hypothetical protein